MTPNEIRDAAIEKMKTEYAGLSWPWLTLSPLSPGASPMRLHTWGECRRIKSEYDYAMSLLARSQAKYNMDGVLNEGGSTQASNTKRPKRPANLKRAKPGA